MHAIRREAEEFFQLVERRAFHPFKSEAFFLLTVYAQMRFLLGNTAEKVSDIFKMHSVFPKLVAVETTNGKQFFFHASAICRVCLRWYSSKLDSQSRCMCRHIIDIQRLPWPQEDDRRALLGNAFLAPEIRSRLFSQQEEEEEKAISDVVKES